MSTDYVKADQIALHLYTKLVSVVNDARSPISSTTPNVAAIDSSSSSAGKIDKWFNLELPDASDMVPRDVKDRYRSLSASQTPSSGSPSSGGLPPPFEIDVLLTIPDLSNSSRVLVHAPSPQIKTRVTPAPSSILLEKWVLSFSPYVGGRREEEEIAPPTMYKHSIPIFRSLFALLRILPAWGLYKRLQGRRKRDGLGMTVMVPSSSMSTSSVLDFDTPLSSSQPHPHLQSALLPTETHIFPPIPHPTGFLKLEVRYLRDGGNQFRLEELESLLSDRFISADRERQKAWEEAERRRRKKVEVPTTAPVRNANEDVDFVPTLVKNQQRDSLISSGGTQAGNPGTSKSPPIPISVRDRRLSQLSSGGALDSSSSPRLSNSPPGLVSRVSTTGPSPSRQMPPPSGIATSRLRKESSPASSSRSPFPIPTQPPVASSSLSPLLHPHTSSSPSHNPAASTSSFVSGSSKRPPLAINPFKSSTISSSTALHIPVVSSSIGSVSSSSIPSGGFPTGTGPVQTVRGAPPPLQQTQPTTSGSTTSPISSSVAFPSTPASQQPRQGGPPTSPLSSPTRAGRLSVSPPNSGGSTPPPPLSSGGGHHRPFAPSSLASVTSVPSTSNATTEVGVVPSGTTGSRKRYSSSFGHRYSTSGAGRGESPGPTARRVSYGGSGSRSGSLTKSSPSSATGVVLPMDASGGGGAEDGREREEISNFVQDIDRRKPLGTSTSGSGSGSGSGADAVGRGHIRSSSFPASQSSPPSHIQRQSSLSTAREASGDSDSTAKPHPPLGESSSTSTFGRRAGEVLRTESEVDQKLKEMNETFRKSLQGLGSAAQRREREGREGSSSRPPSLFIESPTTSGSVRGTGTPDSSGSGVVGRMDLGG